MPASRSTWYSSGLSCGAPLVVGLGRSRTSLIASASLLLEHAATVRRARRSRRRPVACRAWRHRSWRSRSGSGPSRSPTRTSSTSRTPGSARSTIVNYYLAVGDGILRALRDRPVTLERWPGGVHEGVKLATRADGRAATRSTRSAIPKGAPDWVETAHIAFPSGRTADEVCPTELATVAWCAQQDTITFHPWPVRRADVDHPDELRIDLDPQPGTDFADAVRGRRARRASVLDELGWRGFPKTSGNRGVHIYVRIEPRWTFTDVRHAAIAFGRELERRMPMAGHHEVVEGGARREDLRRLQPERPRPHDRLGVLRPAAAARAGVGAAGVGRAAPTSHPTRLHRAHDAGAVRRAWATCTREIDDVAHDLTAAARVVRARRARPRSRRHALPAGLSEDARRADARPAQPQERRELGRRLTTARRPTAASRGPGRPRGARHYIAPPARAGQRRGRSQ